MTDPRVRLSPLAGVGDTAPVLAALDRVHVVVRLPTAPHPATLIASAALVAITGRIFGQVRVVGPQELPANWWGARTFDDLAGPMNRTVEGVDPIERSVAIGDALAADQHTLHMGGGDFTARIGTTPQQVDKLTHGLGLHVAGCLVAGRLLTEALAGVTGSLTMDLPPSYTLDLLSHHVTTSTTAPPDSGRPDELLTVVIAGCGSVGSSTAALLGTAVQLSGRTPPTITLVDPDSIDPERNRWRYPALGSETGLKTEWLVERLQNLGVTATGVAGSVGEWNSSLPHPGLDGILVSSVDSLEGRLEVADVIARETLSVGVAGTALHVQRERLDEYACPFCDYVSADPPTTQATVYAELTGLDEHRVLRLLQPGALLDHPDLDRAVNAGRIAADRAPALVGRPLQDLVRQAYAEVQIPTARGAVLSVAAPHVSWFSGALAAVEIMKQMVHLPLLDRRVDADLGGLPPGLVRRSRSDTTGRCVCRSGVRRDWYDSMYGAA
jgi:hypothetical protein